MIRVVVKEPGKRAEVRRIEPGLDSLQSIVGGYIEVAMRGHRFFGVTDDLVVYCNEEGALKDLPLNFHRPTDGWPIVGVVLAMKVDESGEDVSMTEFEAGRAKKELDAIETS